MRAEDSSNWDPLVSREAAKTRSRQDAGRSSADDHRFQARFDQSIRLATNKGQPTQEVDWIPSKELPMRLGSHPLPTFARVEK
jgi:hypothetical protein